MARLVSLLRLFVKTDVQQPFKDVDLGAVWVVVAAIFVGVAALAVNKPDTARLQHFLPEHIDFYGFGDTQPARIAFYVFFVAIVLGSFVFPYVAEKLERLRPIREVLLVILVTVVGTFVFIVATMSLRQSLTGLVAAMALAVGSVLTRYRRAVNMLWAGAVVLIVLAIAPGFLGTPVINHPETLNFAHLYYAAVDFHYAAMLSQGERLAAGRLLFIDNDPAYGILSAIAIGLFAKFSHAPSFAELIRLVQAGQGLCLIAFVAAAWLRTRGSSTAGRALAMFFVTLTIAPCLGNLGPAIWYPQLSGLRFLMFPVAVVIACLLEIRAASIWSSHWCDSGHRSLMESGNGYSDYRRPWHGLAHARAPRKSQAVTFSSAVLGLAAAAATLRSRCRSLSSQFRWVAISDSLESATANVRSIGGGFGGCGGHSSRWPC